MEDHHHHHHHHHWYEASEEASLQAFRTYISLSKFQSGMNTISLSWVHNCFNYLFDLNKAFARLAVEIDYPMRKWELPLMEEYLNCTLRLLDLLNLVKSSISRVGLSLISSSNSSAIERLSLVGFKNIEINLKTEDVKERNFSGKELVIHLALMEMKRNSDLVVGNVLSSLSSDNKPYFESKKSHGDSKNFKGFIETNMVLKEFKEVHEARDEIQKQLDDFGNKADELFSKILAGRNEVLDVLRHRNQ